MYYILPVLFCQIATIRNVGALLDAKMMVQQYVLNVGYMTVKRCIVATRGGLTQIHMLVKTLFSQVMLIIIVLPRVKVNFTITNDYAISNTILLPF